MKEFTLAIMLFVKISNLLFYYSVRFQILHFIPNMNLKSVQMLFKTKSYFFVYTMNSFHLRLSYEQYNKVMVYTCMVECIQKQIFTKSLSLSYQLLLNSNKIDYFRFLPSMIQRSGCSNVVEPGDLIRQHNTFSTTGQQITPKSKKLIAESPNIISMLIF